MKYIKYWQATVTPGGGAMVAGDLFGRRTIGSIDQAGENVMRCQMLGGVDQ